MVQVRRPSAGQAYYQHKLAEGKSQGSTVVPEAPAVGRHLPLPAGRSTPPAEPGRAEAGAGFFKPVADPGPEWRWLRSAVAGGRASRCCEGVEWAPQRAVAGVDPEPFPDPVLDPAQHLLDLVAQPGQSQRGPGRPVAARPPAVGHDRDGHLEEGRGPGRDLSRWEVDRARGGPGSRRLAPGSPPARTRACRWPGRRGRRRHRCGRPAARRSRRRRPLAQPVLRAVPGW
jgi:hypothetical protein